LVKALLARHIGGQAFQGLMMKTADLCIVGGGLVGATTAYYAAKAGLRVELLEGSELASGASGAAFGGVSVSIYSYATPVVPSWYVDLSKASLELYKQAKEELGHPLDLKTPGSVDPFHGEEATKGGLERVRGLQACGVPCELLDRKQITEVEPALSDLAESAIYCPVDAHVTPPCVVWAFAKHARRLGANLRTGVRALSFIENAGRVIGVRTSEGDVYAGTVVNAAGGGAAALAKSIGIDLPVQYSRGQMFVTERVPPLLRTYVHNIKQAPAGTIVFGATRESGVNNTQTTIDGTREIINWATGLVPALAKLKLLRAWAGVRPVPPDGYPIIGKTDGVDGLLTAVMHRGVTLAPVVGNILADLAARGTTAHDIAPYNLSRFGAAKDNAAKGRLYGE
jgi:glycine/D-amino acid oxidase-like deaminating enzyme